MLTCHPTQNHFGSSLLTDAINYARDAATEKVNDAAQAILPIIMPRSKWNEIWEFECKTAFDYITDGLTTAELYSKSN